MISVNQLSSGSATGEVIQLRDTGEVIQLKDRGALVTWLLPLGNLLLLLLFNRECISGRWGKLSFPIQYKWSVPNNISGVVIFVFLVSDVLFYGDGV